MELTIIIILFYIFSTAAYLAFLFFQKNYFHKAGYFLLLTGFLFHCTALGYGYIKSGYIPVHNLQETLSIAAWAMAAVFLVFQYKFRLKILGIYAAPLAAGIMAATLRLPQASGGTKNIFNSFWFNLHIITIFIGEASFALACGVGMLYLLQEHTIKTKKRGFFYKRLPSLDLLDTTGYACLVIGFSLITIGLMTGFVYAKLIWGRFWSWDPKEVWSGITWLVYAALLHERLAVGWRGRRAAIMAIIGFVVLLFTFFGVNFLLKGHHGDFTKVLT
jgi:cytochrome c-type biogenesis protein CcsB